MLAPIFVPPFVLQLAFLLLAFGLSSYADWLDQRWVEELSNQSGKEMWEFASFSFLIGIAGFVIFMPLHWMVLWGARMLRMPPGRLYLITTFLAALLWVVPVLGFMLGVEPTMWVLGLGIFLSASLGFMGLMTWAVHAWYRKRETAEQRVTDAFILSRKQQIQRRTNS